MTLPETSQEETSQDPSIAKVFRNWSFTKFFIAITVSGLGSQVGVIAVPLVAILALQANAFELGLVTAAQFAPVYVITPLAGVVADRYPTKLVNGACDILRGIISLCVPLLFLAGSLTLPLLCAMAFILGSLKALADVAQHSMLPWIVPSNLLVPGNAAINTSYSLKEIVGPGLGGVLVQAFSAPIALVADGIGFIFSGSMILSVKTRTDYVRPKLAGRNWFALVRDGFQFLGREPRLLWLGICGGVSNFLTFMYLAVFSLYVVRDLGLSPLALGLCLGLGAIGGILGANLARFVRARLPLAKTLLSAEFVGGIGIAILALASSMQGDVAKVATLVAGMFVYSLAMSIYNVYSMSTRQRLVPPEMLGRVTASYRLMSHGAIPIGALVGGALAGPIGLTALIAVSGAAIAVWALVLTRTPFRQLDSVPRGA